MRILQITNYLFAAHCIERGHSNRPELDKSDTIVAKTVTQVRKFTGLTNYYRKFIHNYPKVAKPLHQLVSGKNAKLKRTTVKWTEECEQSFLELKDLCSNTPVLAYPDYTKNFKLYTDASERGLGVVLTLVKEDGKERPIAYASTTLSKSERNYDAHKLEFLALKWSVTSRFHEYLYGGTFDVYTDNNTLTYILTSAKLDAIGQRWIASLGPQFALQSWTSEYCGGFLIKNPLGKRDLLR